MGGGRWASTPTCPKVEWKHRTLNGSDVSRQTPTFHSRLEVVPGLWSPGVPTRARPVGRKERVPLLVGGMQSRLPLPGGSERRCRSANKGAVGPPGQLNPSLGWGRAGGAEASGASGALPWVPGHAPSVGIVELHPSPSRAAVCHPHPGPPQWSCQRTMPKCRREPVPRQWPPCGEHPSQGREGAAGRGALCKETRAQPGAQVPRCGSRAGSPLRLRTARAEGVGGEGEFRAAEVPPNPCEAPSVERSPAPVNCRRLGAGQANICSSGTILLSPSPSQSRRGIPGKVRPLG